MTRPAFSGAQRAPRFATLALVSIGSVVAGAITALTHGWILIAVIAASLGAVAFAYPLTGVLALVAVVPAYDLVVLSLGGTADIRAIQFAWMAAGLGLLVRGQANRNALPRIPAAILVAAVLLMMHELLSALSSGIPTRSLVEVAQTAYLLSVGWTAAAATKMFVSSEAKHSWFRVPALRMSLVVSVVLVFVSVLIWAGVVSPPPRIVVGLAGGVDVSIAQTRQHLFEAAHVGLMFPRFRLLNVDSVFTAAWLLVVMSVSMGIWLDAGSSGTRRGAAAVAWAAAALLALTLSRAAWIVACLTVVALTVRSGTRGARILSGMLLLAVVAASSSPAVSERAKLLLDTQESSFRTHVTMWGTAIAMAQEKPLLGWGPGSFKEIGSEMANARGSTLTFHQTDAHSFVLQEAAESGFPGSFLLVMLVAGVLAAGYPSSRSPSTVAGFWVAMCALVAMGLTMNIVRTEFFASVAGVVLGLADLEASRSRVEAASLTTFLERKTPGIWKP